MTDPRKPIFDALRTLHGPLSEALVGDLTFILNKHGVASAASAPQTPLTAPTATPKALADPTAFFASVRASLGPLDDKPGEQQVAGFNAVLPAMGAAGWPIAYAAYALATSWHETARTMQPVREAYWLSEDWRRANLRYYPWYGRGYVQLTWEDNYRKADAELGLGGALIANKDLAMDPGIAARVMVRGMTEGWFTRKKLADYLPAQGAATADEFKAARRIINGQDKASEIAALAGQFQKALVAGGWA